MQGLESKKGIDVGCKGCSTAFTVTARPLLAHSCNESDTDSKLNKEHESHERYALKVVDLVTPHTAAGGCVCACLPDFAWALTAL